MKNRRRHSPPWRVALTGGGTGGHVYPTLAIHRALAERGLVAEACYFGIPGRAEDAIVPRHDLPLVHVPSAPVAGGSPVQKLQSLARIAGGTLVAARALLRFRPRLVVASGGYASAPVVFAAFLLKPLLRARIVVDEQNLVPGLLNKAASLLADVVLVSFRESAYFMWSNRCVHTGYPVRPEYLAAEPDREEARRRLGLPASACVVLVVGGSLGARSLNRALAAAAPELAAIPDLHVVHGVGLAQGETYDAWADTTARLAASLGDRFDPQTGVAVRADGGRWYEAHRYLHDLHLYQRAADLVVCRAGAGSLAEGLALGAPLLLVPKRGLPGDHQELNAIAVAEKGAAEVLFESVDPASGTDALDAEELAAAVRRLAADPGRREQLGNAARRLAPAAPLDAVVEAVTTVMQGEVPVTVSQIEEPGFVRFQRWFDALVAFLDRQVRENPDSLYVRLYDKKVEEYLRSSQPLVVNKGIKLVGALRRTDLYPFLYENFDGFIGYQKRNALAALAKAERYAAPFADMVARGLRDGYFEVRREAIHLFNRFAADMADRTDLHRAILARLDRRFESFEVRAAALRAAVRILEQDAFQARVRPFLFDQNVRCREAVLDAVQDGLALGRLPDRGALRRFLRPMLITTSHFRPTFGIRERYLRTLRRLEEEA